MRRGRPTKVQHPGVMGSPHSRAVSSDPFAALDNTTHISPPEDELSARFPSVEQFSLIHDSGAKFDFKDFRPESPTAFVPSASTNDLSIRVMERLADDAFVHPPVIPGKQSPVEAVANDFMESGRSGDQPILYQPQPQKPSMVSTGTMTSPRHSVCLSPDKLNIRVPEASSRPQSRPQSRSQDQQMPAATATRPMYLDTHRPASQGTTRNTASSYPSMESYHPMSSVEAVSNGHQPHKIRPSSVYIESNIEFLRGLDSSSKEKDITPPTTAGLLPPARGMERNTTGHSIGSQRSDHIESNVDFLRAMENESDAAKGSSKTDRRHSSGSFVGKHVKRASMTSISLSNTKTLLAGKFGDAFRRFESNASNESHRAASPKNDHLLGPIAGSAPESEISNDDWVTEDFSPEAKREIEKRMLLQEEERVAAAAAKYKREASNRIPGDGLHRQSSSSRASSIQNKVKALLSENRAPTPRNAEGYGHYTDEAYIQSQQCQDRQSLKHTANLKSEKMTRGDSYGEYDKEAGRGSTARSSTEAAYNVLKPKGIISTEKSDAARPPPPPKPHKLRDLDVTGLSIKDNGDATVDYQGRTPKAYDDNMGSRGAEPIGDPDEWQRKFAQRYPSLSGLELVETVVGNGRKP